MVRLIPYILYLFLLGCHQVVLDDLTSLFGAHILLAPLLIVLVALYKAELTTVWFGFCVGLVATLGAPSAMGAQALVAAALGMAAYQMRVRLNIESLYSRLLLLLVIVMTYDLAWLLINRTDGDGWLAMLYALSNTLLTTFVGWIFLLIKDGRLTLSRLKSIF